MLSVTVVYQDRRSKKERINGQERLFDVCHRISRRDLSFLGATTVKLGYELREEPA